MGLSPVPVWVSKCFGDHFLVDVAVVDLSGDAIARTNAAVNWTKYKSMSGASKKDVLKFQIFESHLLQYVILSKHGLPNTDVYVT